jgi:hypothetical protein
VRIEHLLVTGDRDDVLQKYYQCLMNGRKGVSGRELTFINDAFQIRQFGNMGSGNLLANWNNSRNMTAKLGENFRVTHKVETSHASA